MKKDQNKTLTNSLNEIPIQKHFDAFSHMKLNISNFTNNCQCQTFDKYYCLTCKETCCVNCSLNEHQSHLILKMNDYILNSDKIDEIFKIFFSNLTKNDLISNTNNLHMDIIKEIDDLIDEMIYKLNNYKEFKKDEIQKLFDNLDSNMISMQNNVNNVNKNLNNFVNKNKKFFGINNENDTNDDINSPLNDINNIYFLFGYDIINSTQKTFDYLYKLIETMEKDLNLYLDNQNESLLNIKNQINQLHPENDNNTSKQKLKSNQKITKNIKQQFNKDLEHFIITANDLGSDHFNQINLKLNKVNKNINSFKQYVFKSYIKKGNFNEIGKNIKIFANRRQKGPESLFSQRDIGLKKKAIKNYIFSPENIYSKEKYFSENDIILNNPLLNKYFGYLLLDIYDKNFRTLSKELQSSRTELLINIKNDEDEENDLVKIIEGTNEIQIYDKKNNKISKICLKLTKNPYSYVKFPVGCRCIMVGDKIYISGGKDEFTDYGTVLVYDKKKNFLKRITDMKIPRAYHSMIFSDTFNSLMVIGGENESSVEIFDPITKKWLLLPELNVARANIIYYCDNPRGILYVMFGNEGSILDNKYSDVIEFLDLKNLKDGWNILDYRNKSETDLKVLMSIYPLNNDLILLYGGIVFRGNKRSICVFNISKSEITKIQPRLLETLRVEAKKSRKLSKIISVLTSRTTDNGIFSRSFKGNG